MSTVTAMRSVGERQNSRISSFDLAGLPVTGCLAWYVIFLQKSFPLPNTSRQMWTMSSACFGVFDQSIRHRTGGESLARAGRHVNQGTRSIMGERVFKACDGFNLAISHPGRDQWMLGRHFRKSTAKRVRFCGPFGQRFRPME